jgi:hypothetical protein
MIALACVDWIEHKATAVVWPRRDVWNKLKLIVEENDPRSVDQ